MTSVIIIFLLTASFPSESRYYPGWETESRLDNLMMIMMIVMLVMIMMMLIMVMAMMNMMMITASFPSASRYYPSWETESRPTADYSSEPLNYNSWARIT